MNKLIILLTIAIVIIIAFFASRLQVNYSPSPETPSGLGFCLDYDPTSPGYNQAEHIQCCKNSFDSCLSNCEPGFFGQNCRDACWIQVTSCLERAGVLAPYSATCPEKNRGCEKSCNILYPKTDDGWLYCMRSCYLQNLVCCTLHPSECKGQKPTLSK